MRGKGEHEEKRREGGGMESGRRKGEQEDEGEQEEEGEWERVGAREWERRNGRVLNLMTNILHAVFLMRKDGASKKEGTVLAELTTHLHDNVGACWSFTCNHLGLDLYRPPNPPMYYHSHYY